MRWTLLMLLVVRLLCIDCLCTYVNKGGFLITVDSDYAEVVNSVLLDSGIVTGPASTIQPMSFRANSSMSAECSTESCGCPTGPGSHSSSRRSHVPFGRLPGQAPIVTIRLPWPTIDWFAYLALRGYARRWRWAFVRARVCLMTSTFEQKNNQNSTVDQQRTATNNINNVQRIPPDHRCNGGAVKKEITSAASSSATSSAESEMMQGKLCYQHDATRATKSDVDSEVTVALKD
ncbi:hypothetical protein T4A_9156 [Trichinella pseudospiralis]|uniref:Uncharacterized protein n=1 Tax=Trichinella pseudospiralis TaxID=6337 RepID=A0A0V1ER04_TRIPS|nr:hypothetical protein T4A_9156 [Trichinella pseudospiralis]